MCDFKEKTLRQKFRNFIRWTYPFYLIITLRDYFRDRKELTEWQRSSSIPPPHIVKIMVIKEYATKASFRTFIETGTFMGRMVYGVRHIFDRILSIELEENLCRNVRKYFRRYPHIKIIHGDSGRLLPEILSNISEPCLFWLDAHYSGGITAKGDFETPIMQEVAHILSHRTRNHCILIDDARCFVGQNDYPSIQGLKEFILAKCPDSFIEIKDDIIRITFSEI
jgi:hypothetical protein